MLKEFKKFIKQGNVLDLAVAVIIGGAFGNIITSLVNDILMPIIGVILGGLDFTGLSIDIGKAHIMYGSFIQAVVNFFIIAFCIFLIIKAINKAQSLIPKAKKEEKVNEEVVLLTEIRDLLSKKK